MLATVRGGSLRPKESEGLSGSGSADWLPRLRR
jgi:hypothetical protein